MKAVMMSIQPKWCELIANGIKTVEVRKTRPKLEMPFKVYIYCTKPKMRLVDIIRDGEDVYGEIYHGKTQFIKVAESSTYGTMCRKHQKIIGEFVCDYIIGHCEMANADIAEQRGCIKREKLFEYSNSKELYGLHISNLVIYDEPKELSEFLTFDNEAVKKCEHREQTYYSFTDTGYIKNGMYCRAKDDWCTKCKTKPLKRPPQSWCYVNDQL